MRIFLSLILLLWNLAVLGGFVLLLLSDLGWVTKLLALLFVPIACLTSFSVWRGLVSRYSSES